MHHLNSSKDMQQYPNQTDTSQNKAQADTLQPAVHIVIPARYQSTRLPGKPLLHIHGQPMILWVAQKARQADFADDLCIATDDDRIAQVCLDAGYDVVMTDAKHASGTDRLAEVARIKGWAEDDIVVNMQGDEPLVPAKLLKQVKDLLLAKPQCVMATLYEPILTHDEFMRPSVVKVVTDQQGCALYFSRAPIPCDREHALALLPTPPKLSKPLTLATPPTLPRPSASPHNPTTELAGEPESSEEASQQQAQQAQPAALAVPKQAHRHLGLYAYRVRLLQDFVQWPVSMLEELECLEQLRVLENGGKIAIAAALLPLPVGVDTQADLDRLNAMPLEALRQNV